MELINELLAKLPKFASKADSELSREVGGLAKFGDQKIVKIENYYNFWRSRILKAASTNELLSNGWSFSTLSGLASFETYVHTDKEIRSIYFNRSGEIGNTIDAIESELKQPLGGVILYGYGNLLRESYFVEYLKNSKLLDKELIYLIDCSLYYHIFAKSPINPLRSLVDGRQIKTRLLDYLDDSTVRDALTYVRNDLFPMRPVLHLFLGNTFCNVDADSLKTVLDTMVHIGDFVIGEYAMYPPDYFNDTSSDYASEMARIATAELFAISPDNVKTVNISHGQKAKVTEITFETQDDKKEKIFRSMLRREFSNNELISGNYQIVCSKIVLPGKIRLDAFKRLAD